ncbi:SigE family RNA polymerase sigma factor [Amycolatopsis minnesotensis]|uniref:SigE family RNA polymerase sigma factor n=1 Tax=Amycolatopsis minnesotensis TaxID=337894 RepID=A0ABN2RS26_9PSEU
MAIPVRDSEDVLPEEPVRGTAPRWEGEFVAYFEARSPSLRSTAFVLCGDWHRAEDLLQATFLKLYQVWPRLVRRGELDGYARRVLVRVFLHENRRLWRSREHISAEPPETAAPGDPDVVQRLTVRAALAAVPPKQRAVLVLRFWNDLSVEGSADALGCSVGTVKSQTARGLATLRKRLGPQLDDLVRGGRKEHWA